MRMDSLGDTSREKARNPFVPVGAEDDQVSFELLSRVQDGVIRQPGQRECMATNPLLPRLLHEQFDLLLRVSLGLRIPLVITG